MRRIAPPLLLFSLALAACGTRPAGEASPVSAPVQIVERADTVPLDTQLVRLAGLTKRALGQDAASRAGTVTRIEGLTDGLIETRLPFQRLASGYSLESRLRQLQALADRIVAEQEVGSLGDSVKVDLGRLHTRLGRLRAELRLPGHAAPPPIDSILAAYNKTHGPSLSPLSQKPQRAPAAAAGGTAATPSQRPTAADTIH